jgi:hypothetical protein
MTTLSLALRRFSIRTRMNGAIVIVLGLFALVAVTAAFGGRTLSALNHDFMTHSIKELHDIGEVRSALGDVRRHEKDMVIDYESPERVQAHRALWTKALERARASLAAMGEGEADADNEHALAAAKSLEAYGAASVRVLEQIQAGAYDNARIADKMLQRVPRSTWSRSSSAWRSCRRSSTPRSTSHARAFRADDGAHLLGLRRRHAAGGRGGGAD